MRLTLLGALGLATFAASGCWDNTVEPLPLQIGVEASKPTTVTGDTLNFLVTAQGQDLLGVTIDFGDSGTDQFGTSGARTAHITFRHAYFVTGTFLVTATVTDAVAGPKDATVQVTVK